MCGKCVCRSVCMHVCVYVYVYVHKLKGLIYAGKKTSSSSCHRCDMYVCMYLCMRVRMHVYIHTCAHVTNNSPITFSHNFGRIKSSFGVPNFPARSCLLINMSSICVCMFVCMYVCVCVCVTIFLD